MQLEKAQELWNNVENNLTKFEEILGDLQKKTHRRESKQFSFWSNIETKGYKRTK